MSTKCPLTVVSGAKALRVVAASKTRKSFIKTSLSTRKMAIIHTAEAGYLSSTEIGNVDVVELIEPGNADIVGYGQGSSSLIFPWTRWTWWTAWTVYS